MNDTHGHATGDQLLIEVCQRFKEVVTDSAFLARFCGDEFGVIVEGLRSPNDAAFIAVKLIESLEEPFQIDGNQINITPTIGIAVYPDAGESTVGLLRSADTALYRAKDAGKNTFSYFTQALNDHAKRRLQIEQYLRSAIDKKELKLVYQPVYSLADRSIVGAETLLRWENEELGDVSPNHLIPIAEESGLIITVGDWIISTALADFAHWRKKGNKEIFLTINLSPQQVVHETWLDTVTQLIRQYEIPTDKLIFELTETDIIKNLQLVCEALAILVDLGISIILDDFGTGFSSLALLKELPVSGLKIDKSFVDDVPESAEQVRLLKSLLKFAESMEMMVIAEGIELDSQLEFIRKHSNVLGQGYLLSHPISADLFQALIINPSSEQG